MFTIHFSSEKPLYLQIYEHIVQEIREQRLQSGDALPSRRSLADHLGVSLNTVISAYDQLLLEGYIISKERRGFFVDLIRAHDLFDRPKPREELQPKASYQLNFSDTQVDLSFLMDPKVSSLLRTALKDSLSNQPEAQGLLPLREAIVHFLWEYRGLHVAPSQILLTSGFNANLQMLFSLLPENNYAMEDPGYEKLAPIFRGANKALYQVPVDRYGLSVKHLEETDAQVVITTPNHQFPTGIVMGIRRRQRLLDWAEERGAWILEDDYDSLFKYKGSHIPSLKRLDHSDRVIVAGSFSLLFSHAIRFSYMVLPMTLVQKLDDVSLTSSVSSLDQWFLYHMLKEGYFIKILNRLQTAHKKRLDLLVTTLKSLGSHITVIGEDLGTFFLVRVDPARLDPSIIKERALKEQIKLDSIDQYATIYKDHHNTFLIRYGSFPLDSMPSICHSLKTLFTIERSFL